MIAHHAPALFCAFLRHSCPAALVVLQVQFLHHFSLSWASSVQIEDLSRVIPGAWYKADRTPGTRTNLPSALADAPSWHQLPICSQPQSGQDSSDIADYWVAGRWLPERRPDLVMLRSLGVRAVQLRHCAVHPAAEPSLRVFLDRAWTTGLRVVLGIPQHYYFDPDHGCVFTNNFDCHDTVRLLFHQILSTELIEDGGRYHPALEMVLLTGSLDDEGFLARCRAVGVECTQQDVLKAALSAWDGLLKAERELGIAAGNLLLSMPFSSKVVRASAEVESDPCYNLRAPGGCAGQHMMRRLWAAAQDYQLVSPVVIMPPELQNGTTLESLRSWCGYQKDLVSIRDADHVYFLKQKLEEAGVDMMREAGVPLAYDYHKMNRYFDLRNRTRDVTAVFLEVWSRGEMNGDFHTDQTSSEYWGKDEWMAGFGWGRNAADVGIQDFGHHHPVQAVVCESLNGVNFLPQHDLRESGAARWAHTFHSTESADNVTFALRSFYSYVEPSDPATPAVVLHFGWGENELGSSGQTGAAYRPTSGYVS